MHIMIHKGGYQGSILIKSHSKRLESLRAGFWGILTCLIMLSLITGTGQAYSSDNATITPSMVVQVRTELYLYPELENSVSQRSSGGGSDLTAFLLWSHAFPDAVTGISMPVDGSAVAAGTAGGEIALLNSSGSVLWTYQSGAPVSGVGITADGSAIAAGSGNRIMMLDAGGRVLWSMDSGSRVVGIGISPEGGYCAAGTAGGDILFTDSQGGLLWRVHAGSAVSAIAVGPDGAFVAVGTEDGFIYILNSRGDLLWTHDAGSAVQSISVAPSGDVAAGTADSTLILLNSEGKGGVVWTGSDPVNAVHLAGTTRIGAGTAGGYAYLLNGAGVRLWKSGELGGPEGAKSAITAVASSSPADYLAIGSDNQNVYYFAFTSRAPPTVILDQDHDSLKTIYLAALLGDMREAPEIMQAVSGADFAPGNTAGPVPQEAPGLTAAIALGAVAIIAACRRIGR